MGTPSLGRRYGVLHWLTNRYKNDGNNNNINFNRCPRYGSNPNRIRYIRRMGSNERIKEKGVDK